MHDAPAFADSTATEARVLSSVCQLTGLQSLHLTTNVPAHACDYPEVARYAFSLTHLSTLTALTSLDLQLPACYRPMADRYSRWKACGDDEKCHAWQKLWSTQRASLLFAVRGMRRLQHLGCRDLCMEPPELAPLTALTSLTLGGLMPPSQPQLSPGVAAWALQLRHIAACALPLQGMAAWAL